MREMHSMRMLTMLLRPDPEPLDSALIRVAGNDEPERHRGEISLVPGRRIPPILPNPGPTVGALIQPSHRPRAKVHRDRAGPCRVGCAWRTHVSYECAD